MPQLRDIRAGLSVVTAPAIEPVSLAEARWQARVDHADEDVLFRAYIAAARRKVEADTGFVLVDTTFDYTLDAAPTERQIVLPRAPLQSIDSVTSYDDDDASTVFAASKYFADTVQHRIALNDGETWPSDLRDHNALVVRFTAGRNGDAFSVSSLTSSGTAPDVTATCTTASAHGFSTGDRITIAGAAEEAYNGTFMVTVVDTTSFTYTVVSGTPDSPATGTITARDLDAPEEFRLAVLLLVGMFYERRVAVERIPSGMSLAEVPMGYDALVSGVERQYAMA